MNEYVAYARNTESGCKRKALLHRSPVSEFPVIVSRLKQKQSLSDWYGHALELKKTMPLLLPAHCSTINETVLLSSLMFP